MATAKGPKWQGGGVEAMIGSPAAEAQLKGDPNTARYFEDPKFLE